MCAVCSGNHRSTLCIDSRPKGQPETRYYCDLCDVKGHDRRSRFCQSRPDPTPAPEDIETPMGTAAPQPTTIPLAVPHDTCDAATQADVPTFRRLQELPAHDRKRQLQLRSSDPGSRTQTSWPSTSSTTMLCVSSRSPALAPPQPPLSTGTSTPAEHATSAHVKSAPGGSTATRSLPGTSTPSSSVPFVPTKTALGRDQNTPRQSRSSWRGSTSSWTQPQRPHWLSPTPGHPSDDLRAHVLPASRPNDPIPGRAVCLVRAM